MSSIENHRVDIICLVALTLVALVLRLPYLLTIPMLTDESGEVLLAHEIVNGNALPLTANSSYIGPLWIYLVAFAFKLVGVSPVVPRALVLGIGVLTVLASYALGKQLAHGDWRAGCITAILVGANAYHILYNSHVAWSGETTPLFATLAVWMYLRGRMQANRMWLVGAGALFGCAVQTHPFALALLPTFIADYSLATRTNTRLSWREMGLFIAALLIVLSPLIIYNLTSGMDSLRTAANRSYAFETQPTLATTWRNLGAATAMLAYLVTGTLGSSQLNTLAALWTFGFAFVAIPISLLWLARQGQPFFLLACGFSLFGVAVVNRFYALPEGSRYFAYLLPLIYAALAYALIKASAYVRSRMRLRDTVGAWAAGIIVGACVAGLAAGSLGSLYRFYQTESALGRTNDSMLLVLDRLRREPIADIWVDTELENARTGAGANLKTSLLYLLRLEGLTAHRLEFDTEAPKSLARVTRQNSAGYLITRVSRRDALGVNVSVRYLLQISFLCRGCREKVEYGLYYWGTP